MRASVRSLAALPTLVTLGNAFCGFLAVTYVLEAIASGPSTEGFYLGLEKAVWAILVAMVFDFMDGKVARLTGTESAFGVQIDSLSDVISFGLCPALLFKTLGQFEFGISPKGSLVLACFYLFGAVLRLARFNVEAEAEDDHRSFKGLPSPAAAAGVAAIVYLYAHHSLPTSDDILPNDVVRSYVRSVFPYVVTLLGILMWTKFPYIHAANVLLTERRHPSHLLAVLATIGIVAWYPPLAISVLMLAYAFSGPVLYVWNISTGRTTVEGESIL